MRIEKVLLPLLLVLSVLTSTYGQQSTFALYDDYQTYLNEIPQEVKEYFYFSVVCDEKYIALTFDDGPTENTKNLIDVLKQEKIPGTFFLVGKKLGSQNARFYDDPLIQVGMHTFTHRDYRKLTCTEIMDDVTSSILKFEEHNLPVEFFRPAFGIVCEDLVTILDQKNIPGILWNIDSFDWKRNKGDELVNQVIDNLTNGSIILFHDRLDPIDLERVIKGSQAKGFKIVPIKTIVKYKKEFPPIKVIQKSEDGESTGSVENYMKK
jgi:peptidoglycan/xylan/chitin deacetylase (PgdA/CDA1 family)